MVLRDRWTQESRESDDPEFPFPPLVLTGFLAHRVLADRVLLELLLFRRAFHGRRRGEPPMATWVTTSK